MTSRRTGPSAPLVPDADATRDPHEAFAKTKLAYVEFYKRGFAMEFLVEEYGGGSVPNLYLQLVAEEICAVDPASRRRSWSMVWAL